MSTETKEINRNNKKSTTPLIADDLTPETSEDEETSKSSNLLNFSKVNFFIFTDSKKQLKPKNGKTEFEGESIIFFMLYVACVTFKKKENDQRVKK